MSSLYEEFGLDTDIPVTDMSGPEKQSRFGRVLVRHDASKRPRL